MKGFLLCFTENTRARFKEQLPLFTEIIAVGSENRTKRKIHRVRKMQKCLMLTLVARVACGKHFKQSYLQLG